MSGREGKSATDRQASVGIPQEPRSLPCSTRPSRSTPNTLTAPDHATPPLIATYRAPRPFNPFEPSGSSVLRFLRVARLPPAP
jgi:hypothetical protein